MTKVKKKGLNNILVVGTLSKNGRIFIDEGIAKAMGADWEDEWEIGGCNVWGLDKENKEAVVRVTLKPINRGDE